MNKPKYEKPMSLDAGHVAPILGISCSSGGTATDGCHPGNYAVPGGCIAGTDPNVVPACTPGLSASYNCGVGSSNLLGNCRSLGLVASGCATGNDPNH